MRKFACIAAAAAASFGLMSAASAAVSVGVPTSAAQMTGFMNVSQLPANGGAFVFGSGWGVGDLKATFGPAGLTLEATPIGTGDAFWYQNGTGGPGAAGNKQMGANGFVANDALAGEVITFSGTVLSNTLVPGYTSIAFIRDFAPNFSSFNQTTVPLTPGAFSITLDADDAAGRHIQYGFETTGANVWPTDVASKGSVVIAVPEPTTLAALSLGGLMLRRRRA